MYEQRSVAAGVGDPATRSWRPDAFAAATTSGADGPTLRSASSGDGGPGPGWWYVVVDERSDTRCQLTVDPWPGLDPQGRLRFDPDVPTVDVTVDRDLLGRLVALARRRQGVLAPEREVRIGDVFAVHDDLVRWVLDDPVTASAWLADPDGVAPPRADDHGFAWFALAARSDDDTGPREADEVEALAGLLVDVTATAREQAHLAAEEAATGILHVDEAHRLGLSVPVDGAPPGDVAGGGGS